MDMRLAIRGLSVVMSEQTTEHWCPIMLADDSTTLVRTFLLDPIDHPDDVAVASRQMRYTITLRIFRVRDINGIFDFSNSIEQVPLWSDALIVDVEPGQDGNGLDAHAVWNSALPGASQNPASIPDQLPAGAAEPLKFQLDAQTLVASVDLPPTVLAAGLLGGQAVLRLTVSPRPAP
jgi:hypothetical protein